MRKLLLVLALLLLPSLAWAQCNGNYPASTACGSVAGGTPGPVAFSAITGNGITALTGDGTATGPGSVPLTLATVNASPGTFGSTTRCTTITVNGKGLAPTVTDAICTPAFSSVTGNATLAQLPQLAANSIYINATGSLAAPTATAVPACANDGAHGLIYINGTGLQCATLTTGGTVNTAGTGLTLTGGGTTLNVSLSVANNILGSDVALNNTANYFDGPSVAQGTSGTWWASGTVTLKDTGNAADFFCKLWDGTSIIASAAVNASAANLTRSLTLSGYIALPAANIRISCRDSTLTTGVIVFNATGNSKDSSIYVHRIQ